MSITNYFGKPRSKYAPYKSPYTFDNLQKNKFDKIAITKGSLSNGENIWIIARWFGNERTDEHKSLNDYKISSSISELANLTPTDNFINPIEIAYSDTINLSYGGPVYDVQGRISHKKDRFALTNINILFNTFIKEIIQWVENPIWNLIEMLPPINMIQTIILKISEVDKHVEHLEKMVASLCEDNLSLNNRIKALEQRYEHQSHIPVAEPITVAEAVLKL